MSSVAEKLRKARQIEIKVGSCTFSASRATPEQALLYSTNAISDADVCRRHVMGWSGVKECDIIEGGGKDDLPFDRDDFSEAIGEKMDWWKEIAKTVLDDAFERIKQKESHQKK